MKINYKILFTCILLIFFILFIHTYCFGINMNLPFNNSSSENENSNDIVNELYGDDNDVVIEGANEQENLYDEQDNLYENTPTSPSVVTTTTADSSGLTFDNILAIILIVIGIVLILFAVAIFVRFK
mgnify:FL=1